MKLKSLDKRPEFETTHRTENLFQNLQDLLKALADKELPGKVTEAINLKIETVNNLKGTEKAYRKALLSTRDSILKLLEKELKLVPRNYYQKTWLALGLAAFGIPLGVAMGAALGNMAFMGVGIGMGLPIGMAVGAGLDRKAKAGGRQLDYEVPF